MINAIKSSNKLNSNFDDQIKKLKIRESLIMNS